MPGKNSKLDEYAELFAESVIKSFLSKGGEGFVHKTSLKKKNITEYEGKLRSPGMAIFDDHTYITAISFYLSMDDKVKHKAVGAVVFYLLKSASVQLLKSCGFTDFDDEDDASLMNAVGQMFQWIVTGVCGDFRTQGYPEFVFSEPQSFLNNVPLGIDFCFSEFELCQMDFSVKEKKAFAAEFTMGQLKKR